MSCYFGCRRAQGAAARTARSCSGSGGCCGPGSCRASRRHRASRSNAVLTESNQQPVVWLLVLFARWTWSSAATQVVQKGLHVQPGRRHKKKRQKHRSWDEDDVSELVYNRRYQAWADRQAREAEEEDAAATGDSVGAASKQARVEEFTSAREGPS